MSEVFRRLFGGGKPTVALLGALALAAVLLYGWVDPETAGWPFRCPVRWLTGLDCPGCGAQRMLHSLLRGDLREAWGHNAYLLAMLPVIALALLAEAGWERGRRALATRWFGPALIGSMALWTVGRNLPWL